MKPIKHALIMAAGRGTRMLPLTEDIPKAMAQVNGDSLISNGIKKLHKVVENVHITVGYKGALLAKHVVEYDVQSVFNTDGKGNAWWLFNTLLRNLDEPILVLTCDNVVNLDIDLIQEDYHALNDPACMVIPVLPIAGLEGDYIFHENQVVRSLSREQKSDSYCSGIQVVNPARINSLVEATEDFNDLWAELMTLEELKCSRIYPKSWFTIDTLQQLEKFSKNPKGWHL